MSDTRNFDDLVAVMAALRNPDGGCPWDLEQDFKSIAPYTIEEAYEVADAIDREDFHDLREELGDLLLQPVYHAQMAAEAGHFTINDVIGDITEKMITRHPHVFGDGEAQNPDDVDKIWDERKKAEQSKKTGNTPESALDGVTKGLPALLRALKLQKKAAKVGFEWPKVDFVLDKLEEELTELREAVQKGTIKDKSDELGDVLFVVANLARMLNINPETALRDCNNKFERRFKGVERILKQKSIDIETASLEDMEAAWNEEKRKERA
ncbi:MAG: nucleoside triphosphate pyrophosphohydrolase [Alphaproteobacteria bacterium]|nr:nucleoside triphosphate pyrophosphohydrolase [Alphaproteobacteria bacterium]